MYVRVRVCTLYMYCICLLLYIMIGDYFISKIHLLNYCTSQVAHGNLLLFAFLGVEE